MQLMTIEQVKSMVESLRSRKLEAISCGEDASNLGSIKPIITRLSDGGYSIVFDTPVGEVLMRSARQSVRRFGSIDSAMDAVNSCGISFAEVIRLKK